LVEWMVGHLAASRVDWMVDWTVYSMDEMGNSADRLTATMAVLTVEQKVDRTVGQRAAMMVEHMGVKTVAQWAAMMVAMTLETLVEELAE
jgi:NADH/NAD ratio-sensing transcriptional regulator Rex